MPDTRASGHTLQFAGVQHRAIAEAVLVRQAAFQDVGENFHILVAMRSKTHARFHAIFVHHAQRAEAHVIGVVVASERKGVIGVEPAVVKMAALVGFA